MKIAHILDAFDVVINSIALADDADPASFGAVIGTGNTGIGWSFNGTNWIPPVEPTPTLADIRTAKLSAVVANSATLLATGAPVDAGLHIALDDGSRADLTAMATTATAASTGAIPWPESYARGWITIENVRIPLASPADGLALAASVGNYYAAIVQHRRDLKDAALAAVDETSLAAIDIATGWPAS